MVVQNTPTCFSSKQTDTCQTGPEYSFSGLVTRSTSAVKKGLGTVRINAWQVFLYEFCPDPAPLSGE